MDEQNTHRWQCKLRFIVKNALLFGHALGILMCAEGLREVEEPTALAGAPEFPGDLEHLPVTLSPLLICCL